MNIITKPYSEKAILLSDGTTLKFEESLKRDISSLINRSNYYNKVWPFFSFGTFDKEGIIVFSHLITLSCNIEHSTGKSSITNLLNYQITHTSNIIMIGHIYPSAHSTPTSLEYPILKTTDGYIQIVISNEGFYAYYISNTP